MRATPKPSFRPACNRHLHPILAAINLASDKRTLPSIPPWGRSAAPLGFEYARREGFTFLRKVG